MGGAIHCFVPVCLPSCVLAGFRLELDHSAVHAAATLFHRFQAACDHGDDTQEKIDEHILCVTCLFIAVKMEEITNTRLRDIITCAYRYGTVLHHAVSLGRSCFSCTAVCVQLS
eukprot:scpid94511/ scgid2403/ 